MQLTAHLTTTVDLMCKRSVVVVCVCVVVWACVFVCVCVCLTSLWALVEFGHVGECGLHNVQNGQQGARESQQLTEAVEAKVDQVPCQIHHLRNQRGRESKN